MGLTPRTELTVQCVNGQVMLNVEMILLPNCYFPTEKNIKEGYR